MEVVINPKDLRIDVYRSSGPGGQSVNTTDSAVRVTHLPTGLVVTCQDEKSQHKNKAKAMKVLRARLLDKLMEEQRTEISEQRKSQVGPETGANECGPTISPRTGSPIIALISPCTAWTALWKGTSGKSSTP